MTDAEVLCTCDHIYDEHDTGKDCLIEDCPCVYFEEA